MQKSVTRAHTSRRIHSAEGSAADRGQPLSWGEGAGGVRREGGEKKRETALSFTESGGVIRGVV